MPLFINQSIIINIAPFKQIKFNSKCFTSDSNNMAY